MNLLATIVVVTNIGYTVAFDTNTKCPSWVAYDLEPQEVVKAERLPVSFRSDPRIADTDFTQDYTTSGYDRGHMAPAADFNWSTNALRETYYFSNICPQIPTVNRGKWADIEKEMRSLATSGTVHIVTFPYKYTGRTMGRVSVPDYLIKIAYGHFGVKVYAIKNFKEKKDEIHQEKSGRPEKQDR